MPVAVNCCVAPAWIDGLAGVTSIDTTAGAVIVSVVLPLTPVVVSVAMIVVVPWATDVARPVAGFIVAAASLELDQVTLSVRATVEASLLMPVAVN